MYAAAAGPSAAAIRPRLAQACVHCQSDAFEPGWGPRTFIQCDCCADMGAHVSCHAAATGEELQEADAPTLLYYCCEVGWAGGRAAATKPAA